jgi:hypothetical protein
MKNILQDEVGHEYFNGQLYISRFSEHKKNDNGKDILHHCRNKMDRVGGKRNNRIG